MHTATSQQSAADEQDRLRARVAELERELAERDHIRLPDLHFRTMADAMPQMVWATDSSGMHFYFNRRWYEYTGLSEAESLGYGFTSALHPDDQARTIEQWEHSWRTGAPYEIEYRFRRRDGSYHWFIGRAMPVYGPGGSVIEWVGTCTDIDEQKRAVEMQRFLAETSALLADSLDYEETLARVAARAVPHIADWCAVDILEQDGTLRRLGVAHVDPAKVALAHEIERRWPFNPAAPTGLAQVLRSGESELHEEITEELVRTAIDDPELRDIMLALGLRSSMTVALSARGRVLGGITLVSAESGRRFSTADLRLAEELARRAAVAIDNAQLYRELREFRLTLDRTSDCVFMFDPATLRFLYVNQGAVEQVGYSRDELLRMTPLDIKPEYDARRFGALIAPLVAGELRQHTFQTVHRHKDGHDVPVEVALQYVASVDSAPRFVAVVRDISERRRATAALRASEARFRALADSMPLIVWTASPDGRVTYFNQRWHDFSGQGVTSALDWGWYTVIHPEDAERCAERWMHSVRTGERYEIEYRWRRADGVYRWHLGRALPVYGDDGQIAYWVGTGTDIHDQKHAEETLRGHAEQLARITASLEERNRELDQFAYITSHDLKAPLRGIASLAQWIEEDLGEHVTPEIRSQLELLRGRVLRMEMLIDGLLQYSRVGRAATAVEDVDVAELLDDVVDLLAPGDHVRITVAPGMPQLRAERLPLQQVFSNLIGNAIKHHPGPDVQVHVSAARRGALIEFAVTDNGPGIAPEYHERIFGIFQTLASRDRVEGSGLGLALVKKIVERQGGRVWLRSAEGEGATFFFTWPDRHSAADRVTAARLGVPRQ